MINSALMVAGDKLNHLQKIKDLKCDIAIINLEDAVLDKKYALKLISSYFSKNSIRIKNKQVIIRINPLNTTGKDEIKVLNKLKPNAIRISKVKTKKDIKKVLKLVHPDIDIHLSIETKEALYNLHEFKLNSRVTTVYLGILDMLESFGLPQTILKQNNPTINYILSKFLLDSKKANLFPVSFTYQEYTNTKQFSKWCKKEKRMGFSCKSCISPTQVDIVNTIFGIEKSTLKQAKYIKNIFEKYKAKGCTGFTDKKYGFIDEPIYKNSLLVLKLNKS